MSAEGPASAASRSGITGSDGPDAAPATARGMGVPRAEFERRIETTRARVQQQGFAGALVVARSFYDRCGDLAYLTNHFPPFPTTPFGGEWDGIGHGFLLLPAFGDPTLLVDFYRADLVAVDDVRTSRSLAALLLDTMGELGLDHGRLAVVGSDILPFALARSVADRYARLVLEPDDALVRSLRSVKSEAEIAALRQSSTIADVGLRAAVNAVRPAASELAVNAAGTAAAMAAGADFVRYLRVHSGPWSWRGIRWPQATERTMAAGDMVTLDLIGAHGGYGFDILRTAVAGGGTQEQRRLVHAVAAVLGEVVAHCRAGIAVAELCGIAQRKAADLGYVINPWLGHGIGLETVESPLLLPTCAQRLEPGMVLCIEPGIVVPDVGGCVIEDEVVVREGGCEVLTALPREFTD